MDTLVSPSACTSFCRFASPLRGDLFGALLPSTQPSCNEGSLLVGIEEIVEVVEQFKGRAKYAYPSGICGERRVSMRFERSSAKIRSIFGCHLTAVALMST